MKSKLQNHPTILFSNANTVGEGEHKILLQLRKLEIQDHEHIAVFSPDNDLLSLLMIINVPNIFLVRFIDSQMKRLFRLSSINKQLVYISIDEISKNLKLSKQKHYHSLTTKNLS